VKGSAGCGCGSGSREVCPLGWAGLRGTPQRHWQPRL